MNKLNREALFYTNLNNDTVQCNLCSHHCKLNDQQVGFCLGRQCIKGKLYSLTYGHFTAMNLDPIEKKPLYHFYPGSNILSVGSFGCNMKCKFCQNYDISQRIVTCSYTPPEQLIEMALKYKSHDNIGIAFTYNEPTTSIEYILDVGKIIKQNKHDLKIVYVSNGNINDEPLHQLLPYVDAYNIDLKSFDEEFYNLHGGNIATTKHTIETIVKNKKHIEVTTLVIPDNNDSEKEIKNLAKWLSSLDKNIPLHLSRFFPRYHFSNLPPTDPNKLVALAKIAKKYLTNVHIGNV